MKTIEQIVNLGAVFFGVQKAALLSPCRSEDLCLIRFSIMAACREEGYKLKAIGSAFNRDHGTVINGLNNLSQSKFGNRWPDHEKFCAYIRGLQQSFDQVHEAESAVQAAIYQIDAKISALQVARFKLVEAQIQIESASKVSDVPTKG